MKSKVLSTLEFTQKNLEKQEKLYHSARVIKNQVLNLGLKASYLYWKEKEENYHVNVVVIKTHLQKMIYD